MNLFHKIKGLSGGIATDSVLLVFVRVVTMTVSILQSMILARTLSKYDYGTYSQGLLIISFLSPIFSLGLENAVNYFFNKTPDQKEKKGYINTIFSVCWISGIVCGVLILSLGKFWEGYFQNSAILGLLIYVAFRPCIQNLVALYQPIFISCGYAKTIAVRNLIISIAQISIVGGVSVALDDIKLIFFLLLLMDFIQLFCFACIFGKRKFRISLIKIRFDLVKEIMIYAVPMLLSTSIGTFSINIDKLMVSGLMSTEDYALYSNVSKELPFAFIASSFTAVVMPYIIKYIHQKDWQLFKKLWSEYLELGYKVTWPLCVGAAVFAPEMIEVLYSGKYLSADGIMVFRIYTIVAMSRFTYFGMVPAALGKTEVILKYSVIACCVNIILNYPMFFWLGMPGPAAATVISMIVSAAWYLHKSTQLVNVKISEVLKPSKIVALALEMVLAAFTAKIAVTLLEQYIKNVLLSLTVGYVLSVAIVYLINLKGILKLIYQMNNENKQ